MGFLFDWVIQGIEELEGIVIQGKNFLCIIKIK